MNTSSKKLHLVKINRALGVVLVIVLIWIFIKDTSSAEQILEKFQQHIQINAHDSETSDAEKELQAQLSTIMLPDPPAIPSRDHQAPAIEEAPEEDNVAVSSEEKSERFTQPEVDVSAPERTVEEPAQLIFSKQRIARGRVLLKQHETGQGPNIVINWPGNNRQQEQLYLALKGRGMVTAILDNNNALWRREEAHNQRWSVNRDFYSGFMRLVSGRLNRLEKEEFSQIKNQHQLALRGFGKSLQVVRIYPRELDAKLLAGLDALLADQYAGAREISANYRYKNGSVVVAGIAVDGKSVPGRIRL